MSTDAITKYENETIRAFVQSAADEGYFSGTVLDYGSGRQPYAGIVKAAGGEYVPYDAPSFPASIAAKDTTGLAWGRDFDTVLCNQVVQYVENVPEFLNQFRYAWLRPGGVLVMTYPTNWPEVEDADLQRFTRSGMGRLLVDAGFSILRHERRGSIYDPAFPAGREKRITATGLELALGYGVIARA